MMKFQLLPVVFLALVAAPAAAEQQAVIVRSATVYSEASIAANNLGQLQAGTRVSIFSRRGGWKEVFADSESLVGWVRGYQVREGDYVPATEVQTEPDERGFLAGLASWSRRASSFFAGNSRSTSEGTATIGVRGLSEAELKAAQPDPAEFEKMQKFVSNPQRVETFRQLGRLQSVEVEHIQSEPAARPVHGNTDK